MKRDKMMIVIYSQDKTYIKASAEDAKATLNELYGMKFGTEAYANLNNAPLGATFRKSGGPLVKVIDRLQAEEIRKKEEAIGMM